MWKFTAYLVTIELNAPFPIEKDENSYFDR